MKAGDMIVKISQNLYKLFLKVEKADLKTKKETLRILREINLQLEKLLEKKVV